VKTHQLKALVALAEIGSIRGAARNMGLSQSALTKTLRELETQTGAALLVRASRGTRFTPAGKVLVDHARLILTTMRRAEEEVRRISGQAIATARIAVTPVVAVTKLGGIIHEFQRRHPQGQLDVETGTLGNIVPRLLDGQLDLALGIATPEALPADLAFQPFTEVRLSPVSRSKRFVNRVVSWEELANERWLLNPAPGSADQVALDWLTQKNITLAHPPTLCRSPFLLAALNRSTDLIALCPTQILEDSFWGAGLCRIEVPDLPPKMQLGALTRRYTPNSLVSRDIIDISTRLIRSI
jgi:DNA-binding transcriptional LysR family regulator